jgi:N-formylglutamate deformylase
MERDIQGGQGDALQIQRPSGGSVPLLFDTPHSGRDYPVDFGASAPLAGLRRGEDAYVDELLEGSTDFGVTVLRALYPRCYLDLNRAPDDIDQGMLQGEWPGPLAPTEKSERGLGLIRRLVVPEIPIYGRLLSVAEVQARIARVYNPYHKALGQLRAELVEEHGKLWHINWHSMKSVGNAMTPDGPGTKRPDFVVGDLRGKSAHRSFTDTVVGLLEEQGYRVTVNDPYAGGLILKEMGDPGAEIHSIQIEMNRALYLDELAVEKTDGFSGLKKNLMRFIRELAEAVD